MTLEGKLEKQRGTAVELCPARSRRRFDCLFKLDRQSELIRHTDLRSIAANARDRCCELRNHHHQQEQPKYVLAQPLSIFYNACKAGNTLSPFLAAFTVARKR